VRTGYLVFDTESVPDGKLLQKIKYPDEELSPEDAVARAQAEAKQQSASGSDFIPVTFHIPIATAVVRVGADFRMQALSVLGAPDYHPRKIVKQFWGGVEKYCRARKHQVKLVTFNGRGFDMPLLELAAFRYGIGQPDHFNTSRKRFDCWHFDLMDWLTNFNAYRMIGGLNLLSKLLGKPGKTEVRGDQVYQMWRDGKLPEINDYCKCDALDTYFVFLRTRVLTGELTLEQEHGIVQDAKEFLNRYGIECPAVRTYLDNWGDWEPWP
jgi:predicted PolB exonuclease-like 3'-5' exonuclease